MSDLWYLKRQKWFLCVVLPVRMQVLRPHQLPSPVLEGFWPAVSFFPFKVKSLSQTTVLGFWNCDPVMNPSQQAVLQTVFPPVRRVIENIFLKIIEYSRALGRFLALIGPWDILLQTAPSRSLDTMWCESCISLYIWSQPQLPLLFSSLPFPALSPPHSYFSSSFHLH